jgi:hypothetical protein
MKHSEIIRKAKSKLSKTNATGTGSWVCWAILDVCEKYPDLKKAEDIAELIRQRLKGCGTIKQWLFEKKGIPVFSFSDKQIQEYRLRWMDSLITEYERVGK